MKTKRNFTGRFSTLFNLFQACYIITHADEVTSVVENPATPTINYEQLIAQARKEEKDKLYPRIQKLEEENRQLVTQGNNNLLKIGDLTEALTKAQADLNAYKNGEKETEEVTKLKKQVTDLTAELEKVKSETPNVEELKAQFEKEYQVKSYIMEQRNANKDTILSSFLDDISGTTTEEVDKSIEAAKAKSLAIRKELGLVDDEGNPITTAPKKDKKEPKKQTKVPTGNPAETSGEHIQIDAEYIRGLDPSSDEYKEFRKKLGLK